jgi:hypothetical protein
MLIWTAVIIGTLSQTVASVGARQEEPRLHTPAQDTVCLGAETPQMEGLLAQVQRLGTSDGRGSKKLRELIFSSEKFARTAVTPVADAQVCRQAIDILGSHLGAASASSNTIALVRVAGRYVASYRHYAPRLGKELSHTYFFDAEFARVEITTW